MRSTNSCVKFYLYVRGGFFFQAEDGIRDTSVTGVQTCALPIYSLGSLPLSFNFNLKFL